MKYFVLSILLTFFACSNVFAQTAKSADPLEAFPSADDMFSSISGAKGKEFSLADSIDSMISSMGEEQSVADLKKTIRSATEGKLVVEEVVPEINREVVEAVDKKTNRYSPRLQIDFQKFPLKRAAVDESMISAADPVRRIRARMCLDQVKVELNNRVVRLSGTVATERQRELAEMMLRFEPGIDSIQNDLVVNGP